jgi:uncharacterized repeat protein (TIGR01451 family)
MNSRSAPWFIRTVVLSILVSMFASFLPMPQIAAALTVIKDVDPVENMNPGGGQEEIRNVGSVETRYGLVAILVDEEVWEGEASNRSGLFGFLGSGKLSERVKTYARDIQSELPWTKTMIVTIGDEDSPVEIQRLLEMLYFEGDPDDSDFTQLSGVVVIGDVPLPVLNKEGHRFISMLPYTDFYEPSYILDETSLDFVRNNEALDLQSEVWHGVIVPPLDGEEGLDLLAGYFDKNHGFHDGDEEYTTFDEKVFIGDLVTEESTINKIAFSSYERFTDIWEELYYSRYTDELLHELYLDMSEGVVEGDGLDNDGDGSVDEEGANGKDEDGDGLVDEDLGDGLWGIDNDEDGQIDEDTGADNNNDEFWHFIVPTVNKKDDEIVFEDRMVDEDPPGDANGDGCPGTCGVDDNGWSSDSDNDGYPDGWEVIHGYPMGDERKPHKSVKKMVNGMNEYGVNFSGDDAEGEAMEFLADMFVDDVYHDYYQHPSCFDGNTFHPEWDDDEDGFCDEDGSTETQIWFDQLGIPDPRGCAYNDKDCDGEIDEDPSGIQPDDYLDLLPDLQTKPLIENLISRYAEMFQQPQGVWNRVVNGTGRYSTREVDDNGNVANDYDTAISLISKKDEYVLQYLGEVNSFFEGELDEIVEDNLQESIPMIASVRISGFVTITDENDVNFVNPVCDTLLDPSLFEAGCLQFVNHSLDLGFPLLPQPFETYFDPFLDPAAGKFMIYGQKLWEIENVEQCTLYSGTNEEDGQMVEFNTLYGPEHPEDEDGDSIDSDKLNNCSPEYRPYQEDIPEICDPPTVTEPIRTLAGALEVDQIYDDTSDLDTGFGACYEFKEMNAYKEYTDQNNDFNDWLSGEIEDHEEDDRSYEDFLIDVEEKREDDYPLAGTLDPRAAFSSLDILAGDENRRYTVANMFADLGYDELSNDDLDIYLAMNDLVTIYNPEHGVGTGDVDKLEINIEKAYLESFQLGNLPEIGVFVPVPEAAHHIPSIYRHVQPDNAVLNAQTADIGSPALPVDASRRLSFMDGNGDKQELVYINTFDAETIEDVENQVADLASDMGDVEGGSSYEDDVEDFLDEVNLDQLADAIEWRNMSADQKHLYVFSHYLGAEEPIFEKARNGYEVASLIADGNATSMFFGFNGDRDMTEGDLEWMYRTDEAIAAALAENAAEEDVVYEPLSELSNTTPVMLWDWIPEMVEWIKDITDTVSSFDTFGGEMVCGDAAEFSGNVDTSGSGIPDAADDTTYIDLTSDDNNVLQAGVDFYTVSVNAKEADGSLNMNDNYTQVELEVVTGGNSGDERVSIAGDSTLQMKNGVAIFLVKAEGIEGNFSLRAKADRTGMGYTNTLSGSVTSKIVKVMTYVTEDNILDEVETQLGDKIEVYDEGDNLVAVLDPDTGLLDLRGVYADLREATDELPTRIAIIAANGDTYGSFFLIPEEKDISVGDGFAGVFVEEILDGAEAVSSGFTDMLNLEWDGEVIGAVTAHGQISLIDGYYLEFDNPGEINIYDPIHIIDNGGNSIFTVTIKNPVGYGDILLPKPDYGDYLSRVESVKKWWWPWVAKAESLIGDEDGDLLDDLEEVTIGTDYLDADTDGDGETDGAEIFSGLDPLNASGAPLFTDLDATHEAYHAIATLYLRGIVKGYGDGSFLPDQNLTREEFVKVDLGAVCIACDNFSEEYLGTLIGEYSLDPFPDTNINPDLLACVAQAKVDGIVSGYAAGEYEGYFLPGRNISRAEAVKVLVETGGLPVGGTTTGSRWFDGYVEAAELYELLPAGVSATDDWLAGYITRAEFAMMAVNLIGVQDCREVDTDGDGLADKEEELIYGTDPENPDTDGGGVWDLDEVLRGSDPLDPSDDFPAGDGDGGDFEDGDYSWLLRYQHEAGLYAVSENAKHEEIVISIGEGLATLNIFTGEIPADGESVLFVRADIRDGDGTIYTEDDTSVIEFILSTNEHGEIYNNRVQVDNGQAETAFVTSEISGEVEVQARIADGSLPSEDASVWVYPGEPSRLALSGESTVLPAGGDAVMDMRVNMYDVFGNVTNNGFYTVTLETEGEIELLDVYDEDLDNEGVQVTTPDGFVDFRVLASTEAETAYVRATLDTLAGDGDEYAIEHIEGMQMEIEHSQSYLFAGSGSGETVTVSATDANGQKVAGFQGEVYLSVSDPNYGYFEVEAVSLVAGSGSAYLNAGTLAGIGSIIADSPGIESGSTALTIKPAEAYELRMRQDNGTNIVRAGEPARFYIEAYDVYGNLVTTDSSTSGTVRTTTATEKFATLNETSFALNQGVASVEANVLESSGVLNLVASAAGLLAGTWSGSIDYSITGEEFAEIDPQMLYLSLLGGPFGDVTQDNYIGGWLTFNGDTQATTSLISEPIPKKRLATVDANGVITLPEGTMMTQTVMPAGTNLPVRMQWRAFPGDTLMGEVFYVASGQVTAELLTNRTELTLEDGVLRDDSATALKIRDDGQIVILNPNYSLAVNGTAEGLSFVVLKTTEQVMRIDYNADWNKDVELLDSNFNLEDFTTLSAGVYLKPTAASENNVVQIPTGNSSGNPMGLAIIDPDKELPIAQQPSLGYASLEAAENDGTIGWENENKHLLLFAAGNSVGQSNLFYGSEVGVVLGDPTVSLPVENEVSETGFTSDLGTMVAAGTDEIVTLMDIDYNNDGMVDVLAAYDDGRIDVLQNAKGPVRLNSRGTILFIENGISSIDKGDFNKDGADDLLIVSEDSCFADEMCMYVYENNGGAFVARNLTVDGIEGKPTQIEVYDLNDDGYDDLVIGDENMVLYVVWNAEGNLETVDKIRDFGLATDSSENLWTDLAIHHDDMETGSVMMNMTTTELSEGSGDSPLDLDELLDELQMDGDFVLQVDGEEGGVVTKQIEFPLEYAANLTSEFEVWKSIEDANGERVKVGDTLSYEIVVKNVSGGSYSDIYLSDFIASSWSFDDDSFECDDAACDGAELENGSLSRPWMYGPISLANNGSVTLTYDVSVSSLPSITIMPGQDFYGDYTDDDFGDIAISLEGNDTGQLMVYYSDGYVTESEGGLFGLGGTSYKRISYHEKKYAPDMPDYEEEYNDESPAMWEDADEDGIPDFAADMMDMDPEEGMPVPSGYDPFGETLGAVDLNFDGFYSSDEMFASDDDVDNDGLVDIIDEWITDANFILDPSLDLDQDAVVLSSDMEISLEAGIEILGEELENVAGAIEEIVGMFTCNGGCLALPGSIAFLAPGMFHDPIVGTTIGFDQGTPIFGIMPAPPVVCSGAACMATSTFRLYLAPTTTLGLGLGLCFGTYGGACFAFSIPLLQALGVCDALNDFIAEGLSQATSFISEGANTLFNAAGLGDVVSAGGGSGLGSSTFDNYEAPVATNMNIQIPGFPSIFTEWWKKQKYEFLKMLDLPDIIFVYPVVDSIGFEPNPESGPGNDLEHSTKLEEITSEIMGLEKFLNLASSIPLIDIEPETVNISFPSITEEEIALIEQDAQQWIKDTEAEWQEFKELFDLRDDVSAAEQEMYNEFEDLIDGLLSSVEANLDVLESYRELPRKLLELRDYQTYYAKEIICYLDAILSHTAGYILENVGRIEAWAQWVVDLEQIIGQWQALIGLSVDLMDSCDKCTNQRWSALQLIFSLFTFIPEFPVVEMPKLPDVVIDVSHIQAGLDITWPDLNFVPERISFPKLPRIEFPTAYLDLGADLDLKIPVLPEFPILYEFPSLPGLPLPDLPSLPPPPAIPALGATLEVVLDIASIVLKVICIIRQGFIPTSETNLKAKIEEITQRPGDIILPFDLAIQVEWPSISFDFLERVEITTYLNLTADFTLLYDFMEQIGDQSSDMIGDIVGEFEKAMNDVMREIQNVVAAPGELEFGVEVDLEAEADFEEGDFGAGGDLDLETYLHPAMETALEYKDHPMLSPYLTALQQSMDQLGEEFAAWDAEMPDEYKLVASQTILTEDDPLLHRYDEIIENGTDLDTDFLASIEDTPLSSLALLRESMIAYVGSYESGTRKLEGMDSESFNSYLAQESAQPRMLLASDEGGANFSSGESWDPGQFASEDEDPEIILASDDEDWLELGNEAQSFMEGIYLYNSEAGVSERLIDYTEEADGQVSILFLDLDDDGDDDVVYSMGGDVYIKENYEDSPSLKYDTSDPQQVELAEVVPDYGTVKNFTRGNNDFEEASFAFNSADEAVGYEVLFYDSLDAAEASPEENIKRLLLLADDENTAVSFFDEDGMQYYQGSNLVATDNSELYQASDDLTILVPKNADYTAPAIRESRVVVSQLSGKVKLHDTYKRTEISSNGEIETSDEVIFQTLEKTLVKVSIEGDTTQFELPAGYLANFGRASGRVIRVESGSVLWIQTSETEDEQDVVQGMEIFKDELLALESGLADAILETSEGVEIHLDQEEIFIMDHLINTTDPSSRIALENGTYFTQIRAIYEDAGVGVLANQVLLNPQVCADDIAPYAVLNDDEVDVAIFSTVEVSGGESFDSDSEIYDAYWDLDAEEDADGDGIFNNDAQVIGLTAEIGPYDDLDQRFATLWVTDAAGNQDSAEVTVNVYVPNIVINEANTEEVLGVTEPASPDFPFHLVREREDAVTELGDGYLTDEYGDFLVEVEDSDLLAVLDIDGNTIAHFNPLTKQLLVYDENYDYAALAADLEWPSRLIVYEKATGSIMTSFVFVSNAGRNITSTPEPLDEYDLSKQRSVTVHLVDDEESYEIGTDEIFARNEYGSIELMISNTGNISLFDDRYTLVKREADDLDEYLVIELYDDGELEMEIWPGAETESNLTSTEELGLSDSGPFGGPSISGDYRLYFEDISTGDALYDNIAELVERGILEGYQVGDDRYFYPENEINRAEFAKIVLGILCIIPREEAYDLPSVFNDILNTNAWYYPYTKEANLNNLITGYLGELDADGVAPFKPDNTITRAEATKIILEALDVEGVIELPDVTGTPWYEPYLAIAQDLTPYMLTETTRGDDFYILTTDEAMRPLDVITRYEFVEMSVRVLQAYNCFDLDSDGDGLINYDEEALYGTDPYNPDTDDGGVADGTEVARGTDPLNPGDDFDSGGSGLGLEAGIYSITEACFACPCNASVEYESDLRIGDKVFAIIQNAAGEIFNISNTVTIE